MPKHLYIDDSMIIRPDETKDPAAVEIIRGPNIGAPPKNGLFPGTIDGIITIKVGDKITTDHIIPAGARMKYRSNIPRYAKFTFEHLDHGFYNRARQIQEVGRHNIIVAGFSYGQGSSREHAAICPMYLGVKTVIAKSFERIHAANLINFGILPLIFPHEADYDDLGQGDHLEIPDIRKILEKNGRVIVRNRSKGKSFPVSYELSERQKMVLLAGGALNLRS
jgi:aconitate hydratase